jgi:hypothetical protein
MDVYGKDEHGMAADPAVLARISTTRGVMHTFRSDFAF